MITEKKISNAPPETKEIVEKKRKVLILFVLMMVFLDVIFMIFISLIWQDMGPAVPTKYVIRYWFTAGIGIVGFVAVTCYAFYQIKENNNKLKHLKKRV